MVTEAEDSATTLPIVPQNRCVDLDEDCLEMTRGQVIACAQYNLSTGYCPFFD